VWDRCESDARRSLVTALRLAGDAGRDTAGRDDLVAALCGASSEIGGTAAAERFAPSLLTELLQTDAARVTADTLRAALGMPPATGHAPPPRRRPGLLQTLHGVALGKSIAHPRFLTDPYPLYRRLREREPVREDPLAPVFVVTRPDDVAQVLTDPALLKDPFHYERLPAAAAEQLDADAVEARSYIGSVSMLFLDPPAHTRVRSLFARAFTPRRIEALRGRIETLVDERLEAAAAVGRMDLIHDLAYPLPVTVIADLLGFPADDYADIKRWSDDMAVAIALRPTPQGKRRAAAARRELRAYFDARVPRLKQRGDTTLLGALLNAEGDADLPGALDREEVFSNAVLMLAAGHETTTNLIGNGVLALLAHRDQLDRLRADASLIAPAVEELLRYDPPVQWVSRLTRGPYDLGGVTIPPHTVILASLGTANRDPAAFPDPDRLDLTRSPNKHLSFGHGPHFCLGAALARLEAAAAIGRLIQRFDRLRLARPAWALPRVKGLTFRGVKRLPLRVG